MAQMLVNDFNSKVPDNMDDLIKVARCRKKDRQCDSVRRFQQSSDGG